jgi:hypothetical protein
VLNGAADPDKVTLTGASTPSPTFSLAVFKFPMTNTAVTFRLTVTTADGVKTDDVNVTPKADTIAIGTAKWKLGDFRVTGIGTGTVTGGTVTIHKSTRAGVSLGTFTMTAAAPPAPAGSSMPAAQQQWLRSTSPRHHLGRVLARRDSRTVHGWLSNPARLRGPRRYPAAAPSRRPASA